MVVCAIVPRFELLAAVGERRALLGEPVALAPEAGREQVVGEVSAAAEAFGVVRGMRLGEALTRCPALLLVPPDPEEVRALWARALDGLEGIGAEVESDRPGEAYFEARGLERLHGGDLDGVLAAARRSHENAGPVLARPTPGLRSYPTATGPRLGAGPCRFTAYAAALSARPRRGAAASARSRRGRRNGGAVVVEPERAAAFLAPLPVGLLRARSELATLPEVLERLGIRTLGELGALPPRSVAERFGHPGLLALDLATGRDSALQPRRPPEPVGERLALPEAASGQQLEHALELLVARLLARRERRGRTLRALAVSARFVAGGTWRAVVTLRSPSADSARLRLAVGPRLAELPAPAESLALEVESFGPPAREQGRLVEDETARRRARLGEAVRQARQAAGPDAALRVLEVDPDSRLPERRTLLAPFLDERQERRR